MKRVKKMRMEINNYKSIFPKIKINKTRIISLQRLLKLMNSFLHDQQNYQKGDNTKKLKFIKIIKQEENRLTFPTSSRAYRKQKL